MAVRRGRRLISTVFGLASLENFRPFALHPPSDAVGARVLAHRRDHDPVAQADRTDREGSELVGVGVSPHDAGSQTGYGESAANGDMDVAVLVEEGDPVHGLAVIVGVVRNGHAFSLRRRCGQTAKLHAEASAE